MKYSIGKLITAALVCLVSSTTYAQLPSFQETLKKANMIFAMPDGFVEVPVVDNRQMKYAYAIKDTAAKLEFRYRIDIIDTAKYLQETKRIDSLRATGHQIAGGAYNPNEKKRLATAMMAVTFNVSDQKTQMPDLIKRIMVVPSEQVKKDFNADGAFVTVVPVGKEFGQDYKMCAIGYMHKNNVANVWTFILFDDQNVFQQRAANATRALKFKPDVVNIHVTTVPRSTITCFISRKSLLQKYVQN